MKPLSSYPAWIVIALGIALLVFALVSSLALGTNGFAVSMVINSIAIMLITSPWRRSNTK